MDFERIKQEKFSDNNSRVLRAINTLRTNYLNEGGYIKLRETGSRREVEDLADGEPERLEAKLTAKGIAFLNGRIDDPCIRR